ncbi:MAG: flavin reductase [Acutalibacteraceae bacterium]|nr:flavin reductase [Acutalibacteraceae bacterium]
MYYKERQIIMINEKALNNISYGLYVLSARENGKDNGCIINTVSQVTVSPLCISVAVNKSNYTHDMIMRTGEFNVSVICEGVTFDLFTQYGFKSGRDTDKVEKDAPRTQNGITYVKDNINTVISAKVKSSVDLGTHTLFIAEVTETVELSGIPSVTYAYYHANIKPKPTVQSETNSKKWVCTICGFVYDDAKEKVPFEQLPDDWTCPLCNHPKSDFELM